jgi:hypothetical protein
MSRRNPAGEPFHSLIWGLKLWHMTWIFKFPHRIDGKAQTWFSGLWLSGSTLYSITLTGPNLFVRTNFLLPSSSNHLLLFFTTWPDAVPC